MIAAQLYSQLRGSNPDMVFSPLSVSAALRLAWFGARGDTAGELSSALEDSPVPSQSSGSFTFRMANTAWVQQGTPLDPGFTDQVESAPMTTLAGADFAAAPDEARTKINHAIAEETEQRITGLLGPGDVSTDTRLVLANAVYLKGSWRNQFSESATTNAPFHRADGTKPKVRMMHGTANRQYKRGDGYQAVLLPYQDSSLAMAIVLPDGPLADLGNLSSLLDGMTQSLVVLALPRFRLQTRFDLIPALQSLGIRQAFTPDADFTGITTAARLRIGAIAHQAYIDVDEHGTEAAAATGITMVALAMAKPPPRVELTIDRPFLFAIIDTATGSRLFLGQVSNP